MPPLDDDDSAPDSFTSKPQTLWQRIKAWLESLKFWK